MLDRELMDIAPEAPLSRGGAWRLAQGSLPATRCASGRPVPFCVAGGRATGSIVPAAGQDDLAGRWVCAIGAFDGLHRGHQELLRQAREEARCRGCRLAAVTFSPDPADVLGEPQGRSRLLTCEERSRGLLALDVDAVVAIDFTAALATLDHLSFMGEALLAVLDVDAVVVGSDFRLGAAGAGTVEALAADGRALGFDVCGLDLLDADGEAITATRTRCLVRAGRVEAAAGLLGRCLCVTGVVEHGRGEGTSFGFPTANVMVDALSCVPDQGVYACLVTLEGEGGLLGCWPAAVNVGVPPTFAGQSAPDARTLLEANLIGFAGDAYGHVAHVTFVRWLRDSRPFSSLEELERTVRGNIGWTARSLGEGNVMGGGAA